MNQTFRSTEWITQRNKALVSAGEAIVAARNSLDQTVVHCFIHAFSRWISRTTFILRERHE